MSEATMANQQVENVLRDWPGRPRAMAESVLARYGPPAEASANMLVWENAGGWRRTVVHRDETRCPRCLYQFS